MALGAVGVSTQIWNNNAKSIVLLCCYPLLFFGILWAIFAGAAFLESGQSGSTSSSYGHSYGYYDAYTPASNATEAGWQGIKQYGLWVILGVTVWFGIAFLFHQRMINAATGAKPITREEYPTLYNLLENLCISRGLTMPKLCIINTAALNAYASGLNKKTYTITVTTGLVEALDDQEMEAVLAHELTHIMNQDVRLLVVSVIFVGLLSFLCEIFWRGMRSAGRGKKGGGLILVGAIVLAVGYGLSILLRFALSRKREYLADAGATELTKNPSALASALRKISGRSEIAKAPDEVRQMFIDNPPKFFSLFSTHPSMEDRLAALEVMGAGPYESTKPLAEPEASDTPPPAKRSRWPWGKPAQGT